MLDVVAVVVGVIFAIIIVMETEIHVNWITQSVFVQKNRVVVKAYETMIIVHITVRS